MQLLSPGSVMLPPMMCVVCANTPPQTVRAEDYIPLVDTGRDIDSGNVWAGNGRVYVCGTCARSMAGLFGLGDVDAVKVDLDAMTERAVTAEAKVAAVDGLLSLAGAMAEKARTEDTGLTDEQKAANELASAQVADLEQEIRDAREAEVADIEARKAVAYASIGETPVESVPSEVTRAPDTHPLADWGKTGEEDANAPS